MKQKLEMLGEDIDKNKESLQKAKEIAGEKASEYFNKAMN
ncbi:EsaC protein within ESAT-6 gene cluster [Staphylococcus aureus]|nr:EsaC protein within ESAT-6 gene cluster [Staphylococcus aureus]